MDKWIPLKSHKASKDEAKKYALTEDSYSYIFDEDNVFPEKSDKVYLTIKSPMGDRKVIEASYKNYNGFKHFEPVELCPIKCVIAWQKKTIPAPYKG